MEDLSKVYFKGTVVGNREFNSGNLLTLACPTIVEIKRGRNYVTQVQTNYPSIRYTKTQAKEIGPELLKNGKKVLVECDTRTVRLRDKTGRFNTMSIFNLEAINEEESKMEKVFNAPGRTFAECINEVRISGTIVEISKKTDYVTVVTIENKTNNSRSQVTCYGSIARQMTAFSIGDKVNVIGMVTTTKKENPEKGRDATKYYTNIVVQDICKQS